MSEPFDPKQRAAEKALSRAADVEAIRSGKMSRAELASRNGAFAFGSAARINWNAVRSLG